MMCENRGTLILKLSISDFLADSYASGYITGSVNQGILSLT